MVQVTRFQASQNATDIFFPSDELMPALQWQGPHPHSPAQLQNQPGKSRDSRLQMAQVRVDCVCRWFSPICTLTSDSKVKLKPGQRKLQKQKANSIYLSPSTHPSWVHQGNSIHSSPIHTILCLPQCTAVHICSLVPSVSRLICSSIRTFYLFNFWLWWGFFAAHGISLVVASGGYSLLQWAGFSFSGFLLLESIGSNQKGFSTCIMLWIMGSRVQAQ